MNRIKEVVLVSAICAAFLVCVLACGGDETSGTGETKGSETAQAFTVVNWKWKTGEYGNRYIVGTVKNNTNKQYSYVQIEFNLYDKSGAQVGSTMDNINNLEPQGTWKFEAIVMEDKATQAKLKGVSGW